MTNITRDLYISGRVWLSLTHTFTQTNPSTKNTLELVKVYREDFVTLNAGALFVLSLWSLGGGAPERFTIPEYKIHEFKSILSTLLELKFDEKYVKDNTLTESGKASNLYYRLLLNNKKYIDVYFVETEYNGEKSVNVNIEHNGNLYPMYDSNVSDIIANIPTTSEITRYKQDAAQLYYIKEYLLSGVEVGNNRSAKKEDRNPPRKIQQVDRTEVKKDIEEITKELPEQIHPKPKLPVISSYREEDTRPELNYESLLEDE